MSFGSNHGALPLVVTPLVANTMPSAVSEPVHEGAKQHIRSLQEWLDGTKMTSKKDGNGIKNT